MKIVVLDGYTLNPGDLDWADFEGLGALKVYDRTPAREVYERAKDVDILLTNKTEISSEVTGRLKHLKYIGELATGFDNIAVQTAAQRNIPVCNVPGYSTPSVAQLTWALLLELCNQVGRRSIEVKQGAWTRSKDFSLGSEGLIELKGKTLGLVGLGAIGAEVARIGLAFGMKVIAAVRHPENYRMQGVKVGKEKEEVYTSADVLSLHLPLHNESKEMINARVLEQMKTSAFLINTSRGGLIREKDLAEALEKKKIAGAAVDVLTNEPPSSNNLLLKAPNCLITPHIAWATRESRKRLLRIAACNIQGFLEGKLRNVVNGVE